MDFVLLDLFDCLDYSKTPVLSSTCACSNKYCLNFKACKKDLKTHKKLKSEISKYLLKWPPRSEQEAEDKEILLALIRSNVKFF